MLSEKSLIHSLALRTVMVFTALAGLSACEEAPTPPKAVSSTPVTLYKVQHSDETIAKFPGQVEAAEYKKPFVSHWRQTPRTQSKSG